MAVVEMMEKGRRDHQIERAFLFLQIARCVSHEEPSLATVRRVCVHAMCFGLRSMPV